MSLPLAEFLAGVLTAATAAVLLIGWLNAYVPAQHIPWKPLTLNQPVGLATRWKLDRALAEPGTCRTFLAQNRIAFSPVADKAQGFCVLNGAVQLRDGAARLSTPPVMDCALAARYALWERQVVEPAAREVLGSTLARIEHFGAYSCRTLYGQPGARPSEHARAAAVDIAAFRLADGRRVTVLQGWNKGGPEAAFLRRVRDGGCGLFGAVLSPDYNAAHQNHLHLDLGPYSLCR